MNEKSLEVLKQYDLNVYRTGRGRGGMLLNTDSGTKLFLECMHPDKYYEREDILTKAVFEHGFEQVDTYIRNVDGKVVTADADGRRYVLKNWFDGRECNVRDMTDVCGAVSALGRLHTALNGASAYLKETLCEQQEDQEQQSIFSYVMGSEKNADLRNTCRRHMRELKMASNYLKNKKKKSEFEMLAYRNIHAFYEEAAGAVLLLNDQQFNQRFERAKETGELCHGSFNYHNVLFGSGFAAVTNLDKCRVECQIVDLYQFMRKILEKYDWDIQVAYKMMDEYDKVKAIPDEDLELLAAMFAFPEKFWKLINYYFNANKAWIPPKSIEKLKTVIAQNAKRQEFLTTLM